MAIELRNDIRPTAEIQMVSAVITTDADTSMASLSPTRPGRGDVALDSFIQSFNKGIEAVPVIRQAPGFTADRQSKGAIPKSAKDLSGNTVATPRMPPVGVDYMTAGGSSRVASSATHSCDYSSSLTSEAPQISPTEIANTPVLASNSSEEESPLKTFSEKMRNAESLVGAKRPSALPYVSETDVDRKDVILKVGKQATSKATPSKPTYGLNAVQLAVPVIARTVDDSSTACKLQQSLSLPAGSQLPSNEPSQSISIAVRPSLSLPGTTSSENKCALILRNDHLQSLPTVSPAAGIDAAAEGDSASKPEATGQKDSTVASADRPDVPDAKVMLGPSVGAISVVEIRQLLFTPAPAFHADQGSGASSSGIFQETPLASMVAHEASLSQRSDEFDNPGMRLVPMSGLSRMIDATPTCLEVGVHSETHGWLRVRAELTDTGAVNASIAASSPERQAMLHRELPGITAYLHDEKVVVGVTVAHSPINIEAPPRQSAALGARESGSTSQRNDGGGQQRQNIDKLTVQGHGESARYGGGDSNDENAMDSARSYVSGRGWLSVRA